MSLIVDAVTSHNLAPELGCGVGGVGEVCVGSKFHSPTPLVVTPEDLACVARPHPARTSEMVFLCGVCYDNLRTFVLLMVATEGDLEWEVRREFGNRIRDLGMKAWAYYQEGENA